MTKTITLQFPVTIGGEKVTTLTVRRPKMRDIKKSQTFKDDLEKSLRMIADLAEIEPKDVEELDPIDFGALVEAVGEFMGDAAGQASRG